MITIETIINNEELMTFNTPILASGDVGTVRLKVSFDENWNGFQKTGVFFNSKTKIVYEQKMVDDSCVIPFESLTDKGFLYVGVRGINENSDIITSTLLRFNILEGAPVGTASMIKPADDIYTQLMSDFAYIKKVQEEHLDKLNEIDTATTECYSAISALQLTWTDYDGGYPNTQMSDENDADGGYPTAREG